MTLDQILIQLGLGVTSSFIYERVRDYFSKNQNPTIEGLKNDLASHLSVENANVKADGIVEFLAKNGDIYISGSHIYASKSIIMDSSENTKFTFGNNSVSKTDKSSIEAGFGSQIVGNGGGKIEQDEDGNIKFST